MLVVKSAKDTRYGSHNQLRSHDGLLLPCHPVHALRDVSAASVEAAELIAIDEAQFFPDLAEFVTRAADRLHKHVLVAGLDGDFRRQNWEQVCGRYTYNADSMPQHRRMPFWSFLARLYSFRPISNLTFALQAVLS